VAFLWLAIGLALLTLGAEWLVRGASTLALAARISPLVVGLTVVAFGTSAPELFVTVSAIIQGEEGIALGNVVGSNIFNVLFILAISAMIVPLSVAPQLLRVDLPVMIGASTIAGLLAIDGGIGRYEGIAFLIALACYTSASIWISRRSKRIAAEAPAPTFAETAKPGSPEALDPGHPTLLRTSLHIGLVIVGLALLVAGSRLFTEGAVEIARNLGVSEFVIGVTLVAAGTSLPEVAASVMAAVKGERDIAVGNVVGSNIFNMLCVFGAASAIGGDVPVPYETLTFDFILMIGACAICFPICWTGRRVSRLEGAFLFALYLAYLFALWLRAPEETAAAIL
jgi:cation:H+ antiporter